MRLMLVLLALKIIQRTSILPINGLLLNSYNFDRID
jgi:hypothetical protein